MKESRRTIKALAILIAMCFPFAVEASVIRSQTAITGAVEPIDNVDTASTMIFFPIGTGLTGTVQSLSIYVSSPEGAANFAFDLRECPANPENRGGATSTLAYNTASCTSVGPARNFNVAPTLAGGVVTATSSGYALNPLKYYAIRIQRSSDNLMTYVYGRGVSGGSNCYYESGFVGWYGTCRNLNAPYFVLDTTATATAPIVSALTETGMYSATSTQDIFNCGITDIGCYLKEAFAWAFVPVSTVSERITMLSDEAQLHTPFGYGYDIATLISDYSAQATTSLNIAVELSPVLNFMGGNFPTTSVTLLSGSALRSTMGTTMWNFSQNLLSGLLWVGFMIYVYRRTIHFV